MHNFNKFMGLKNCINGMHYNIKFMSGFDQKKQLFSDTLFMKTERRQKNTSTIHP